MAWFSTKVRLAVLVEPKGADGYMDSVYIFRQGDVEDWTVLWSRAFQRALELGRQQEQEYLNPDSQRVRWRLKEIISLDIVRAESLDGAEVYSEPADLASGDSIPFDAVFAPERSVPTQTGI